MELVLLCIRTNRDDHADQNSHYECDYLLEAGGDFRVRYTLVTQAIHCCFHL